MKLKDYSLFLSTHLIVLDGEDYPPIIIHRQNGIALHASTGLVKFLELFRRPLSLQEVSDKYNITNLETKIDHLLKIYFLLFENFDDEQKYIEQTIAVANQKLCRTENFIIYHPKDVTYPIAPFAAFMEKVYLYLLSRGFERLRQKSIVFICDTHKEFRDFWGKALMPSEISFYVTNGRILVIKPHTIYTLDLSNKRIFNSMVHEMVHIFLCQNYVNLPVWAVEGLCEYFSTPDYRISLRELICFKRPISLSEIDRHVRHSLLDIDNSPVEFNIGYRQSSSFMSFLAESVGEEKLIECVLSTGLSKDFKMAFEEHFSQTLEDNERQWRKTIL